MVLSGMRVHTPSRQTVGRWLPSPAREYLTGPVACTVATEKPAPSGPFRTWLQILVSMGYPIGGQNPPCLSP